MTAVNDTRTHIPGTPMPQAEAILIPPKPVRIDIREHREYIEKCELWKTLSIAQLQRMFSASYTEVQSLIEEIKKGK